MRALRAGSVPGFLGFLGSSGERLTGGGRPVRYRGTSRPAALFHPGRMPGRSGRDARRPRSSPQHWRALLFAAFVLVAVDAHACAVCWGSPNDPMVKGANNGIWVLLGVIAVVQAGFIALFWSFWRRAREQKRFRESLRVIHPFDAVENSMRPMQGGPQS